MIGDMELSEQELGYPTPSEHPMLRKRALVRPKEEPFKCPVCEGKMTQKLDVYADGQLRKLDMPCRPCKGEGIIWRRS